MFLQSNGTKKSKSQAQREQQAAAAAQAQQQQQPPTENNANIANQSAPAAANGPQKMAPAVNTTTVPAPQPVQRAPAAQPAPAHPPPPPAVVANLDPNKIVPIQITLPPQPNVPNSEARVLTIQVPASALQENQLHQALTSTPIITSIMSLPPALASSVLQQHVNAVLQNNSMQSIQMQKQVDGAADDTSEEEGSDVSDDNLDNDDDDMDKDEDEDDVGDIGADEEPLNSDDDVSEEEQSDLFDTDNVIVCQYDKVIHNKHYSMPHIHTHLYTFLLFIYVVNRSLVQETSGSSIWKTASWTLGEKIMCSRSPTAMLNGKHNQNSEKFESWKKCKISANCLATCMLGQQLRENSKPGATQFQIVIIFVLIVICFFFFVIRLFKAV